MAGNYLTFIVFKAKLTSKTIDYENVPLKRVEKARSPLVQVKSIGQPSTFSPTRKHSTTLTATSFPGCLLFPSPGNEVVVDCFFLDFIQL